ncbi:MAG: UDP-N-acetylmuramoyl-tripeptide--D-alanyl-D-alanine ligase [Acidobacteriota bacterium]
MRRTAAELARRLSAPLSGADTMVTGVAIDSRAVRPGDLFVAIPGERVDGHDFLAEAAARGAAAALVGRRIAHELSQVVVPDPVAALQAIAAVERVAAGFRVAAVTGSVAKTTTKEILAALLARSFRVGATRGSRNSQAGFPAELCSQPDGLEWFVAELGMSHAGELDRLGRVAQPDALLYTVIAPVHLEYFPSVEAIAEAKAELIPYLRRDGTLVVNADDPLVNALADRFPGRVVRYGTPEGAALRLEGYEGRGLLGARFRLAGPGLDIPVDWEIAGRHQATNLLAAAACALALGVPAGEIAPCAALARPSRHRGEVFPLASGATLVDDSYNASPVAVRQMLELLAATPGHRVAVLGEMLELGERTLAFHREVGALAGRAADLVVAVGGPAAGALAAAVESARAYHVPDAAAALDLLGSLLRPGDVILVKGSRAIALDRLADTLRAGRKS